MGLNPTYELLADMVDKDITKFQETTGIYSYNYKERIPVCRLGFNPTKKNEEYKTKLKTVA